MFFSLSAVRNTQFCSVLINFRFFSFYYIALAPEILCQLFKAKPEIWSKRKNNNNAPKLHKLVKFIHLCGEGEVMTLCVVYQTKAVKINT